jgi:hypothetical protein
MHKKLFLKVGENVKLAYSNFQHFVKKNLVENVTKLQWAVFFSNFLQATLNFLEISNFFQEF